MIYLFHGDNVTQSRQALNQALDALEDTDILRLDAKDINPNQISLLLNNTSLLPLSKALVINNLFSMAKSGLEQSIKLLSNTTARIYLWNDKALTATQLKNFPQASVTLFKNEAYLFSALYSIKPNNFAKFQPLYQKIVDHDEIDLFMYFLRSHFRKLIIAAPQNRLAVQTYLQLIELDYQQKTGQLTTPKDIALNRIIFHFMS